MLDRVVAKGLREIIHARTKGTTGTKINKEANQAFLGTGLRPSRLLGEMQMLGSLCQPCHAIKEQHKPWACQSRTDCVKSSNRSRPIHLCTMYRLQVMEGETAL